MAGQDASESFYELHRASILKDPKYRRFVIGRLAGTQEQPLGAPHGVVPYGEAHGSWRTKSPYYKASHHTFRAALRAWIEEHVLPNCVQDDEEGTYPSLEFNQKLAEAGIIACIVVGDPRAKVPLTLT